MTGPWRKSSRSSGQGGECVEWRKSSRSNQTGGNCVEARTQASHFQVRDSKLGDASPVFSIDRTDFAAFVAAIKSGSLSS